MFGDLMDARFWTALQSDIVMRCDAEAIEHAWIKDFACGKDPLGREGECILKLLISVELDGSEQFLRAV
jgi:hypothetical protein